MSFTLCGFQAVHVIHEPLNHLMPYLPLCLLLAHRFMTSGNFLWISGLALAWGTQLTLGHFQIQMWTAGLVILSSLLHVGTVGKGKYRVICDCLPLWRSFLGVVNCVGSIAVNMGADQGRRFRAAS